MFEPPRNILAYVHTGTKQPQRSIERAMRLAEVYGAKLKFIDVIEDAPHFFLQTPPPVEELELTCVRAAERAFEQYVSDAKARGIDATAEVRTGSPSREILREIVRFGHDAFVKTRMREGSRFASLLGSTGIHLLRHAPCPVWVVDPHEPDSYDHVVVAVETSPYDAKETALGHRILDAAISLAESHQSRLTILNAWANYGDSHFANRLPMDEYEDYYKRARDVAEENLRSFLDPFKDRIEEHQIELHSGEAADVIASYCEREHADLLVIGTVGRHGLSSFTLGNTAELVLRHLPNTALAIKPKDFVCPIELD